MKIKQITLKEYNGKESIESIIMPNNEELLSVKELEQWLPWKAANIRKLLRSGKIKGRKIYTEWYISRENLYKFLSGK
ncbi:DNA-binding protein [Candidatus Atribacteria bacterium 1244-E10-H5-B2]|jgi:hypothetical protein|nr:MAG: DNA-binding protein [Candidatus Atribacteria bacterium 1244-E10-H5-B2]